MVRPPCLARPGWSHGEGNAAHDPSSPRCTPIRGPTSLARTASAARARATSCHEPSKLAEAPPRSGAPGTDTRTTLPVAPHAGRCSPWVARRTGRAHLPAGLLHELPGSQRDERLSGDSMAARVVHGLGGYPLRCSRLGVAPVLVALFRPRLNRPARISLAQPTVMTADASAGSASAASAEGPGRRQVPSGGTRRQPYASQRPFERHGVDGRFGQPVRIVRRGRCRARRPPRIPWRCPRPGVRATTSPVLPR
jgi:hypothetical protein